MAPNDWSLPLGEKFIPLVDHSGLGQVDSQHLLDFPVGFALYDFVVLLRVIFQSGCTLRRLVPTMARKCLIEVISSDPKQHRR